MIFNCLNCGVSISTNKDNCPHCRINNQEALHYLNGQAKRKEHQAWMDKIKGSILTMVAR